MPDIKVDINTKALQTKLKIVHKCIGNMLEEFDAICDECGSTNTEIVKVYSDEEIRQSTKHCNDCNESLYEMVGK